MILPLDGRPRLHAALRAEAEVLARAWYAAYAGAAAWDVLTISFDEQDEGAREWGIEAQVMLLRDLSLPASMDAAARRLAQLADVSVGAVAPSWSLCGDATEGYRWLLGLESPDSAWFCDPESTFWTTVGRDLGYPVPGMATLKDPASAMIAALRAMTLEEPLEPS